MSGRTANTRIHAAAASPDFEKTKRTLFDPRAGAAATGLFLGGLAISAAVALVTSPLTPRLAIAETIPSTSTYPSVHGLPDVMMPTERDAILAQPTIVRVAEPHRM